jgi:hypothetical protein
MAPQPENFNLVLFRKEIIGFKDPEFCALVLVAYKLICKQPARYLEVFRRMQAEQDAMSPTLFAGVDEEPDVDPTVMTPEALAQIMTRDPLQAVEVVDMPPGAASVESVDLDESKDEPEVNSVDLTAMNLPDRVRAFCKKWEGLELSRKRRYVTAALLFKKGHEGVTSAELQEALRVATIHAVGGVSKSLNTSRKELNGKAWAANPAEETDLTTKSRGIWRSGPRLADFIVMDTSLTSDEIVHVVKTMGHISEHDLEVDRRSKQPRSKK